MPQPEYQFNKKWFGLIVVFGFVLSLSSTFASLFGLWFVFIFGLVIFIILNGLIFSANFKQLIEFRKNQSKKGKDDLDNLDFISNSNISQGPAKIGAQKIALSFGPLKINLTLVNRRLADLPKRYQKQLRNFNFQIYPKQKPLENQPSFLFVPSAKPEHQDQTLLKHKKYLQIALNSTLEDAQRIINSLPTHQQIILEAGTPLLKTYGVKAVSFLKSLAPNAYIVADTKVMDMSKKEVDLLTRAGANAITCLGAAPIETIDAFVSVCRANNIEAMIDMMNVGRPLEVLKKLKQLPKAVILHRGVDETEVSFPKKIPYYQIKQIKGNFNILVSVAGGDTIREIQSAFFNEADIVVVWKKFMQAEQGGADFARQLLGLIDPRAQDQKEDMAKKINLSINFNPSAVN